MQRDWDQNSPGIHETGALNRTEQEMPSILVRKGDSTRERQTSPGKGYEVSGTPCCSLWEVQQEKRKLRVLQLMWCAS